MNDRSARIASLLVGLTLGACSSFDAATVRTDVRLEHQLPRLEIEFDDMSFRRFLGITTARAMKYPVDGRRGLQVRRDRTHDERILSFLRSVETAPRVNGRSVSLVFPDDAWGGRTVFLCDSEVALVTTKIDGEQATIVAGTRWTREFEASLTASGSSMERFLDEHQPPVVLGILGTEAQEIIRREFARGAMVGAGEAKGKIVFRITAKEHTANWLWAIPTVLTVMLNGVLGVPMASQTATIGLEAQVVDSTGRVLGTYSGSGAATEYAAFYWGYSAMSSLAKFGSVGKFRIALPRATIGHATLAALEDVLRKLSADSQRLQGELSTSG